MYKPQKTPKPSISTYASIEAILRGHGIPSLLTYNAKDFERFGEIITIERIDNI
jgi:hypothetical protein